MDDQSFNIEALKIILKYCIGLDPEQVCESTLSGRLAIEIVKKDIESSKTTSRQMANGKFNLIFMDCNMPDMDGY